MRSHWRRYAWVNANPYWPKLCKYEYGCFKSFLFACALQSSAEPEEGEASGEGKEEGKEESKEEKKEEKAEEKTEEKAAS